MSAKLQLRMHHPCLNTPANSTRVATLGVATTPGILSFMNSHGPRNSYRLAPSLKVSPQHGKLKLSWIDPRTRKYRTRTAGADELLGLKLVAERPSLRRLARDSRMPVSRFYRLLSCLDRVGILEAPPTILRRDPALFDQSLTDDKLSLTYSLCSGISPMPVISIAVIVTTGQSDPT